MLLYTAQVFGSRWTEWSIILKTEKECVLFLRTLYFILVRFLVEKILVKKFPLAFSFINLFNKVDIFTWIGSRQFVFLRQIKENVKLRYFGINWFTSAPYR